MIRRRKKKKGFGFYFAWLLFFGLAVWGGLELPKFIRSFAHLDVDTILAESELKDKKFAAQVQPIQYGTLTAYLLEEHSNPIISISFSFQKAGTAYDAENQQGLANVAAAMLTAGAGEYDEQAFRDICAEYGIKIGFSVSADDFSGYMAVPSRNMAVGVKLLKAALTAPRLDADYLQLVKQQTLTALRLQEERPGTILGNKFKEFIFAGHPYARNSIGVSEQVSALTPEDVRRFVQTKLGGDNVIVGIAGDINRTDAQVLLADIFGALPEKTQTTTLPFADFSSQGREYNVARRSPQAMTSFVAKGTRRDSLDFYPLYMANYIFGESGLSSRLSKKIREEKGLTYGIYTYLTMGDAKALIEGSFSATPDNFSEAQNILKKEWLRLGQKGVKAEELEQAKNALISSFNLRFAAIDDISDMLVAMQKYSLGIDFLDKRNDYIRKVSLKEVNAAAKKYFSTIPDFVNIGVKNTEEN